MVYNTFNAKRLSFDDGFSVFGGQHPRFLQLLLSKKISYETFIVFEDNIQFTKKWNKQIKEKVVWPTVEKKVNKYKSFVKYNNTAAKMILKDVFVSGE